MRRRQQPIDGNEQFTHLRRIVLREGADDRCGA
jgi:hypothetical protein